LPPHSVATATG